MERGYLGRATLAARMAALLRENGSGSAERGHLGRATLAARMAALRRVWLNPNRVLSYRLAYSDSM